MSNKTEIIERYLSAFYRGDTQAARECLADEFSFVGPAASFGSADAFLQASAHVARGVRSTKRHKVFVDGDDICLFYDLVLDPPIGNVPVSEWYHMRGDRIASIRLILDTASFAPRKAGRPGDSAVDPVCRMTVQKGSAAATRTHGGATYYFCNAGCAVAFEQEPEKYLAAT